MFNSDYNVVVKNYLRKKRDWEVYCENLKTEMDELQALLDTEPAPKGTKFEYEGGGSGGWDKPSQEEAAAMQREADSSKLQRKRKEYTKMKSVLIRLDRSIDALAEFDRQVVIRHGVNGEGWKEVADGGSESFCRRRFAASLGQMVIMLFGDKADTHGENLTFLDSSSGIPTEFDRS